MDRSRRCLLVVLGTACLGAGQAAGQLPDLVPEGYPNRSVYIEAGGLPAFEGGPFSVNVEQRLVRQAYLRLGAFYGQVDGVMSLKVPILLNYVTPGRSHNLELGGGVRWDVFGADSDDVSLAATIAYRYHELPGRALVRAGLNFDIRTLTGGASDAWTFGPWPSLSVGLGF
jgi:hypothetical protein